jgi:hypothetical protein
MQGIKFRHNIVLRNSTVIEILDIKRALISRIGKVSPTSTLIRLLPRVVPRIRVVGGGDKPPPRSLPCEAIPGGKPCPRL